MTPSDQRVADLKALLAAIVRPAPLKYQVTTRKAA
jgi:hypothetical protein